MTIPVDHKSDASHGTEKQDCRETTAGDRCDFRCAYDTNFAFFYRFLADTRRLPFFQRRLIPLEFAGKRAPCSS